jgi:hypothetical protein
MRSSPSRPGEHAAAGTEAEGGRGCRREREGAKAAEASVMAGRQPDRRAMRREDDGGCARRQQREISGVMSWELYYLLYAPVKRMAPYYFNIFQSVNPNVYPVWNCITYCMPFLHSLYHWRAHH